MDPRESHHQIWRQHQSATHEPPRDEPGQCHFRRKRYDAEWRRSAKPIQQLCRLLVRPAGILGNSFQPFKSSKLRSWQYSAYITDSQQVTKNLTLGYGISWAYFPVSTHGSYGLENFNLDTHHQCADLEYPEGLRNQTPKDLFSPHVGFAFRPSISVVLRGGFSIATDSLSSAETSCTTTRKTSGTVRAR